MSQKNDLMAYLSAIAVCHMDMQEYFIYWTQTTNIALTLSLYLRLLTNTN